MFGVGGGQRASLPADAYYRRLVDKISVSPAAQVEVRGWLNIAAENIVRSVRPHLGDVDYVICGSFASGTQIASEDWDVNIALRVYSVPPTWDDAGLVLTDLHRWLHHDYGDAVERRAHSVTLRGGSTVDLDVLPFVRYGQGEHKRTLVDPSVHRDRLLARDASLGDDSVFLKLIRVIKHLSHRTVVETGWQPLSGYEIETLALAVCVEPFALAEGVADFLATIAKRQVDLDDSCSERDQRTSAWLSAAHELAESALMTPDESEADSILSGLFGAA